MAKKKQKVIQYEGVLECLSLEEAREELIKLGITNMKQFREWCNSPDRVIVNAKNIKIKGT